MTNPWAVEAHAVEVAATLTKLHGDEALSRATARRSRAEALGNIKRADLYCAVCTILADRNGVFSRWRATF